MREEVGKCMDYTDLNKAYPKDLYSLPSMDMLIYNSDAYKLLLFIDTYSDNNQIPMCDPNRDKIAFVTEQADY